MVRFTGRTDLVQYITVKPDPYGIKLWSVSDSNGYMLNTFVYNAAQQKRDGKLTLQVLINLSKTTQINTTLYSLIRTIRLCS